MTLQKIYLANKENTNYYKIGVSKNPTKRLKQLQTGNEFKLNLIKEFHSIHPFRLEQMLHSHYSIKQSLGEWFELNAEDILDFLNVCKQKEELMEFLLKNNHFFN